MQQPYINWTKTYDLNHRNGFFHIYISSHKNGDFFGAVFYYLHNRQREQGIPVFEFKLEQFDAPSEKKVYKKCVDWVNFSLPGKYSIIEIGTTYFNSNED